MLRVLKSNKGVMFDAVCAAMVDVVKYCASQELLLLLLRSDDKHPSVRAEVAKYLSALLLTREINDFGGAHVAEIQNYISKGLKDAVMPVRAEARNAFHSFRRAFPEQAEAFLESCDPMTRKKLESTPPPPVLAAVEPRADVQRIWAATEAIPLLAVTDGSATDATPPKVSSAIFVPTPLPTKGLVVGTTLLPQQHGACEADGMMCPFNTPLTESADDVKPVSASPFLNAVVQRLGVADVPSPVVSARLEFVENGAIVHEAEPLRTADFAPKTTLESPPPSPKKHHISHVHVEEPLGPACTPATAHIVVETPKSPHKPTHHVTKSDVDVLISNVASSESATATVTPATAHIVVSTPASPKKHSSAPAAAEIPAPQIETNASRKARRVPRGGKVTASSALSAKPTGEKENASTKAAKGKAVRVSKDEQKMQASVSAAPISKKEATPIAKRTRRQQGTK